MSDKPEAQTHNDPNAVDPGDIVRVLQESHPDAVFGAYWRVRAERAEAKINQAPSVD